jgi:hypothetical protein
MRFANAFSLVQIFLILLAMPVLAREPGQVSLIVKHSGKCVDVWGGSRAEYAAVEQYDCHGGPNQLIDLIPTEKGYFQLKFAHSGICLAVFQGRQDNGAVLQQYGCEDRDNQLVSLNPKGSGFFEIRFKHSGKCADANGTKLEQWDCQGRNSQLFRISMDEESKTTQVSLIFKHTDR